MALDTRNDTIDDRPVSCTPLPARRAARLLARLMRHIGPALSQLRGVDLANVKDADLADFGPAIAQLFNSISADEFDSLSAEILVGCTITMTDGEGKPKLYDLSKPAAVDAAFTGELKLMFRVMAFSLGTNFGNFFDGLGRSAGAAEPAAVAPSE